MIEKFIDSVLILDDVEAEIAGLKTHLEQKDIWVKYFSPATLREQEYRLKNRKLIFLDLHINPGLSSADTPGHISFIRSLFTDIIGLGFGTYGIIMWTAYPEEVDLLKKRMQNDKDRYDIPLFIIALNKNKYLSEGWSDLFTDINAELNQNLAASFFIQWNEFVMQGKDNAILNIYSLVNDYSLQDQNLKFILLQLAKNYSGVPLEKLLNHNLTQDALKAFSDMLHYEILSASNDSNFLFNQITELFYKYNFDNHTNYEYSSNNHLTNNSDDKSVKKNSAILSKKEKKEAPQLNSIVNLEKEILEIYSTINTKLLIDKNNLNQTIVIPGNIYSVISDSPFKIPDDQRPPNSLAIIIEVTPPCDFSNGKKGNISRIVAGYICDYNSSNIESLKKKGDSFYKEFFPVFTEDNKLPKIVVLDFKYFGSTQEDELKNNSKFRMLFRAKDKLFADILQKLASHAARLGLAVIH
jgi:hypothetical protein